MRVLLISAFGDSLPLALRLQDEGCDVLWYVHSPDDHREGHGLVRRVPSWLDALRRADLVVIDEIEGPVTGGTYGGGRWAQMIRRRGIPCIGGTPYTDRLENDRDFGQKACRDLLGLKTTEMFRFRGPGAFDQALKFVKTHPDAYVLKHNVNCDKNLTSVQWTPEAMEQYIDWLKVAWPRYAKGLVPDFVLQPAVKGLEIATTAFFDGERFHGPFILQEYKRLLNGDIGPQTGAMGEVGFVQEDCKLWRTGLAKMADKLKREDFRGVIDLSYIATDKQLIPLEFSPRFGYGSIVTCLTLCDAPVLDVLWLMATGEGDLKTRPGYAAYATIASGTFPHHDKRNEHIRLDGDVWNEHVWLSGVQRVGDGVQWNARQPRTPKGAIENASSVGMLGYVSGYGDTPQAAREAIYRQIGKLKILPYPIYRTDIGVNFPREQQKLEEWGWLRDPGKGGAARKQASA